MHFSKLFLSTIAAALIGTASADIWFGMEYGKGQPCRDGPKGECNLDTRLGEALFWHSGDIPDVTKYARYALPLKDTGKGVPKKGLCKMEMINAFQCAGRRIEFGNCKRLEGNAHKLKEGDFVAEVWEEDGDKPIGECHVDTDKGRVWKGKDTRHSNEYRREIKQFIRCATIGNRGIMC